MVLWSTWLHHNEVVFKVMEVSADELEHNVGVVWKRGL